MIKYQLYFDIQYVHLIHHCDAQFLHKLLDRKLRYCEARSSWANRWQSVSWHQYFPCQKTMCACTLSVKFSKCHYSAGWTKGKRDPLSPWWAWKKLLKCMNASFAITVSWFWAFNSGSCMRLWDLCTEFHSIISWWSCSILCCMTMLFFWLVMTLNKGNIKKVHNFDLFLTVLLICVCLSLSLSISLPYTHACAHTHTHTHNT